ncbi:MAG TPA: histidinol-phosphatase [Bacteroidales bacterium]|nr:histidinol-phosphatase [Bacteroidales bacterium]
MNLFNLHTHSNFCDGSSPPEDYVQVALEKGFSVLGFSSHAPLPFESKFALNHKNVDIYTQTIRSLSYKYAGQLEVYLSMEIDYIPGVIEDFGYWKARASLDYVIGGVHLLVTPGNEDLWFINGHNKNIFDEGLRTYFNGDIELALRTYFNQMNRMVAEQKPDVIAHIDKIKMHNQERYFSVSDRWYLELLFETLEIVKTHGCIVEVNTRGIYKSRSKELYPNLTTLKRIKELEIPVTLSSDAHSPEELAKGYPHALDVIKSAGINELMVFSFGRWEAVRF